MPNPLEQSINTAIKANDFQKKLFARMGTSEHPRGVILSAYRNARRSMAVALLETRPAEAARDIMSQLQRTVQVEIRDLLQQAMAGGTASARLQLGYYGIQTPEAIQLIDLYSQVQRAEGIITDTVGLQSRIVEALLISGNLDMILGDEQRIGVLRPGDVLLAGAFWLSTTMWSSFSGVVQKFQGEKKLQKQAIAAIDNRTTDCCLRVHGQVVDLDGSFKLTGTPRYADEMEWSPFHGWCRTAVALYDKRYDLDITDQMTDAADQVLNERSQGINKTRRPADAYG